MIRPKKIRLEASSICQLRCPACPTASKAIHPAVGSGWLRFRDFRNLIEENPWLREIELSNYGEIFLNPDLSAVIRAAFERGIRLTANNGTNFNSVSEDVLEDMVRYRFHSITCSIDGASSESYGIYRVKGNFDAVIENIKKLNRLKKKYRSRYPLLLWQFVVFGHNEHEIHAARELARQLQMDFYLKLSWDMNFSPVRDREVVKKEFGLRAATRDEFKESYGVDYVQEICDQLWDQPQVNWNGKILGCCRNFWGDFGGNAFKDGLSSSLNNEKIEYARAMLLGSKPPRADIPCTTCDIYLGMKMNKRWLKRGWTSRQYTKIRRKGLSGIIRFFQDAFVQNRRW